MSTLLARVKNPTNLPTGDFVRRIINIMGQIGNLQKIVIVEDNTALADIYKTRLELLGYTCFIAYNGITGLYFIQKELPDLVLLDLMIPDIPGEQVLATMRHGDWGKDTKVLIISNLSESDAPASLRQLGIEGYAVKANLSNDQIDQLVNNILRPDLAQPDPQS